MKKVRSMNVEVTESMLTKWKNMYGKPLKCNGCRAELQVGEVVLLRAKFYHKKCYQEMQISEEKKEKTREVLVTVVSRIEKAKELGVDTKWMEEKLEKIKNEMSFYPDDALLDSRELKRQVNELIERVQENKGRL